jgi:hypothetical protein
MSQLSIFFILALIFSGHCLFPHFPSTVVNHYQWSFGTQNCQSSGECFLQVRPKSNDYCAITAQNTCDNAKVALSFSNGLFTTLNINFIANPCDGCNIEAPLFPNNDGIWTQNCICNNATFAWKIKQIQD